MKFIYPERVRSLTVDLSVEDSQIFNSVGFLIENGDYFWSSPNVILAGKGVAKRIQLGALESDDPVDELLREFTGLRNESNFPLIVSAVCGFIAFPFRRDEHAELIIPEFLFGKLPTGFSWVTYTGERDLPDEDILGWALRRPDAARSDPSQYEIVKQSSLISAEDWRDQKVTQVKERILDGQAKKVVLARELLLEAAEEIPVSFILENLFNRNQNSYVFVIDGFIGASPELLISRFDETIKSNPLAGTAKRYIDANEDKESQNKLLHSTKDAYEHKVTIEWLLEELLPFCSFVDADPEPKIVTLPHVHHLGTEVMGQLSTPPANVLELVRALHPTPAVAGDPQSEAISIINEMEEIDRKHYAGPVGWVGTDGNGEFAVGIRSAEIHGSHATLFAGVGLVSDSDPQSELEETEAKFKTMLSIFRSETN